MSLKYCGILCVGLYRQVDPRPSAGSYNRYVITNPPEDFMLYPSDKVRASFILAHYPLSESFTLIVKYQKDIINFITMKYYPTWKFGPLKVIYTYNDGHESKPAISILTIVEKT